MALTPTTDAWLVQVITPLAAVKGAMGANRDHRPATVKPSSNQRIPPDFGGVEIARRLMTAGHGGQIRVAAATAGLVSGGYGSRLSSSAAQPWIGAATLKLRPGDRILCRILSSRSKIS